MQIILAVDIGTTSICVLAMDAVEARILVCRSASNDSNISQLVPGRHEQSPVAIQRIVEMLLEQVIGDLRVHPSRYKYIRGIAVTGQMHGVLLLDKHLQPVSNLVTWQDQRTLSGSEAVLEQFADAAGSAGRCGCLLKPGYGGLTLHWLGKKNDYAALIRKGEVTMAGVTDFVVAQLCGKLVTDPTMAASWGILNIGSSAWDEQRLDSLQIPLELLPQICDSATPVATLLPGHAVRWGLSDNVQVCTGLGDNQATVIATGSVLPGNCVINIGTGAQISLTGNQLSYKRGLEIRPLVQGSFIQVGSSLCGGWAYANLAKFFQSVVTQLTGTGISLEGVLNRMNVLAQNAAPDTDGLTYNLVHVKDNYKTAYEGINTRNFTPGNLSRATVDGIIRELYYFYELAGYPEISRLFIGGNAVKFNSLFSETIVSMWKMTPVLTGLDEEAAAGAAYLAAVNMSMMSDSYLLSRKPAHDSLEKTVS